MHNNCFLTVLSLIQVLICDVLPPSVRQLHREGEGGVSHAQRPAQSRVNPIKPLRGHSHQSEAPPLATYRTQGMQPTVYSVPCTARRASAPSHAAEYCAEKYMERF